MYSRSNWNLEASVFVEGRKPENPEKNPRSKDENQQQTQPGPGPGAGIDPGPHWWEARALTTEPPLPARVPISSYQERTSHPLMAFIAMHVYKNTIQEKL